MRALLVENNAADVRLLREALTEGHSPTLELKVVERLGAAVEAIAQALPEVVLVDLTLPDASGLEAVRRIHDAAPSLPIVVLTGVDDDDTATRAMQEGAQDYLVKGKFDGQLLARALRSAVERKRAEEDGRRLLLEHAARLEAEKVSQARAETLGIVSHDLRNPLSVIAFASKMLRRPELDAAGRARSLDKIDRAVTAMQRLIFDLLDITRIDGGQLVIQGAPLPPEAILADACDGHGSIAEEKSITLEAATAAGCRRVLADRERVRQVLSNLLGNAIKFTPEGGSVTLHAEPAGDAVRFRVSDTGPGIPVADRERVFERFWRANRSSNEGTGLGLAIAKGIVEAHGGKIWVEPAASGGASFLFTLPAARDEVAKTG